MLMERSSQFIEKKLRELATLAEINKEIHATMNLDRLLHILVEKAVIGVNFERGLIYLVEDQFLRCVAFLDRVKKEKASTIKDWVGFKMDETAVEVLAVVSGKAVHIQDARKDKRINKRFLKVTDTREYCVVPLIGRTGVLGVLTGDKFYSQQPILPEDIETLALFAGHIGLAIENARLYEEKERFAQVLEKKVGERTSELALANERLSNKMKELSTLFEMSKLLSQSLELEAVLDHILSMVARLGHPMCAIHLWDRGRTGAAYQRGLDEAYEEIGALPLEKQTREKISKGTEPVLIPDLQRHVKPSPLKQYLLEKRIPAAFVVPLRAKKRLLALLVIYAHQPDSFKEDRGGFFSAFAKQGGIALENALIFQAILDQRDRMKTLSNRLEQENICLREKMKADLKRKFIIGNSPAMNDVMDLVRKVAPTATTVIIYGETGTGKELIAHAIHDMGPRKHEPLIKVNCAAIPEDLLESELFGHEKGAFTGAHERRIGMFQLAHKGTIFLDEIGDLSLKTQTKLLRVLQENEIQPLGSKSPIRVDVRMIAATNKDLQKRIEEEGFRPDLFYRLNVFPILLPPLRERSADLRELTDFFLEKYAHLRQGRVSIDQKVLDIFGRYSWPGNIRELENIIERLMIISKYDVITENDLPKELRQQSPPYGPVKPMSEAITAFKKQMVRQALASSGGKKSEAAMMLGMPRSNFSRLLKQLGMK